MVREQNKTEIVKKTERSIVQSMGPGQRSRVRKLGASASLFMSLGKDIVVTGIAPNVGAQVLSVGLMMSGQSMLDISLVAGLSREIRGLGGRCVFRNWWYNWHYN